MCSVGGAGKEYEYEGKDREGGYQQAPDVYCMRAGGLPVYILFYVELNDQPTMRESSSKRVRGLLWLLLVSLEPERWLPYVSFVSELSASQQCKHPSSCLATIRNLSSRNHGPISIYIYLYIYPIPRVFDVVKYRFSLQRLLVGTPTPHW